MSQVVFVLLPGVHLLDLAGPAQVFSTAADFGQPYRLSYVAEREQVCSAQGLPLAAHTRWPELGPDDLVVVPGWRAPTLRGGPELGPATLERLRAHHAAGGTVASVCAGAEALGQAGLLDGRRCTTHHHLQDELAARHPRAIVARDVLFTTDDRVVTSAGIASGIDLALHLLAVRHGPALAAQVARDMVVYARRNGHEPQASAMLRHRSHLDDTVHRVQDLIDARFAEPLSLAYLAAHVGVSERTLTRLFSHATGGLTPLRYQQTLRLERAEHLVSHGTTVETAAREVGFEDARMLRRLRARAPS
ncbi:DJ-1/PfpI family protein [Microtetraspora sp. NBRC 16547]|uniref:GlxA family transcriptional regulator n=1 Tax=Microtetraspora sp. NBRC 16547 TaxID=3030993 RepID=UPI0024A40FB1|nr:DJ-1/PfpI family protein [Microtetraspora sp. NBRC 16547]GLW99987.1 AraC family transcriptional regulator [Microtetraspora sp. NBRC 16547]